MNSRAFRTVFINIHDSAPRRAGGEPRRARPLADGRRPLHRVVFPGWKPVNIFGGIKLVARAEKLLMSMRQREKRAVIQKFGTRLALMG